MWSITVTVKRRHPIFIAAAVTRDVSDLLTVLHPKDYVWVCPVLNNSSNFQALPRVCWQEASGARNPQVVYHYINCVATPESQTAA